MVGTKQNTQFFYTFLLMLSVWLSSHFLEFWQKPVYASQLNIIIFVEQKQNLQQRCSTQPPQTCWFTISFFVAVVLCMLLEVVVRHLYGINASVRCHRACKSGKISPPAALINAYTYGCVI